MDFSLTANIIVTGFAAEFDSWIGDHLRRQQNLHIVVKVAGLDCSLSPILAGRRTAAIAVAPLNSNSTDIICLKRSLIKIV